MIGEVREKPTYVGQKINESLDAFPIYSVQTYKDELFRFLLGFSRILLGTLFW